MLIDVNMSSFSDRVISLNCHFGKGIPCKLHPRSSTWSFRSKCPILWSQGSLEGPFCQIIKTHFTLNGFSLFLEYNKLIIFKTTCWEQIFGIYILRGILAGLDLKFKIDQYLIHNLICIICIISIFAFNYYVAIFWSLQLKID